MIIFLHIVIWSLVFLFNTNIFQKSIRPIDETLRDKTTSMKAAGVIIHIEF